MTNLLLDIDFRATGNSDAYIREGWAAPEATHRWTLGQQSRLALPLQDAGPDCVLVIHATPCRHPPGLAGQMVMLAAGGRLLATQWWGGLASVAYRLPAGLGAGGEITLDILHLNHAAPRAAGQVRDGLPLGLMLHSVRVFRLGTEQAAPRVAPDYLAEGFESIGQGCHFGLIQRECGVERPGLLRFVDTTTSMLYEALVAGFRDIGAAGRFELYRSDQTPPTWRWRQVDYNFWFDTCVPADGTDPDQLMQGQTRRLGLLRRKFLEDVAGAEKIFVHTRTDCLTEPEALAVFCALRLHGPATLLWTVFGDAARAGEVECLAPGFLCGHLGGLEPGRYASVAVWLEVMKKAVLF